MYFILFKKVRGEDYIHASPQEGIFTGEYLYTESKLKLTFHSM